MSKIGDRDGLYGSRRIETDPYAITAVIIALGSIITAIIVMSGIIPDPDVAIRAFAWISAAGAVGIIVTALLAERHQEESE